MKTPIIAIVALLAVESVRAQNDANPVNPLFDTTSTHTNPLSWISIDHFGALDVRFIDFNKDGDLDLVTFFPVFNEHHPAPLYTGPGGMHAPTPDPWGAARWIRFWENDLKGNGEFNEVLDRPDPTLPIDPGTNPANADFPFALSEHLWKTDNEHLNGPYVIEFLDVNMDGHDDLVIANQRTHDRVYYWDPAAGTNGQFHQTAKLMDAELSGTVFTTYSNPWENSVDDLFCDDQNGAAQLATSRFSVAMDSADLNFDGLPDLLMGYRDHGPVVLLNNHGAWHPSGSTAAFVEEEVLPEFPDEEDWAYKNIGNRVVMLGDLDRDGDQDLVIGRSSSDLLPCQASTLSGKTDRLDAVRVYKNVFSEGQGQYFESAYKLAPGVDTSVPGSTGYLNLEPGNQGNKKGSPSLQITLADLNNDGALDLIVPVQHSPRNWYDPTDPNSVHDPNTCGLTAGTYDHALRDYRTRVYLGDGNGYLGKSLILPTDYRVSCRAGAFWDLTPRLVPTYRIGDYSTINSTDNLRAAFAHAADFDNDGDLDLGLAHNTEVETASGPQEEIYEEMDRLWFNTLNGKYPGTTAKDYFWRSGAITGAAFPDAFPPPLGAWHISTDAHCLPFSSVTSSTNGEEYNDNTRYIRSADLDNDGDLDWVECQFFNRSCGEDPGHNGTDVFAQHVRVFLSDWSEKQTKRF